MEKQPLRKIISKNMIHTFDSDTLHLAQQLLHFSQPCSEAITPPPKKRSKGKQGDQLLTPPHKIIKPLNISHLDMSPAHFKSTTSTFMINSCKNVPPEELLRQHRLRFKVIRKRWQRWHRERRMRLSRFDTISTSTKPSSSQEILRKRKLHNSMETRPDQ